MTPFYFFWVIVFCISLFCLLHSYVFFPFVLDLLAKGKKSNGIIYEVSDHDLPTVSILLAVYNEQKVIEHKIQSTFKTSYPLDKIEFLIGSDASTDETNDIINRYKSQYPQINLIDFKGHTSRNFENCLWRCAPYAEILHC